MARSGMVRGLTLILGKSGGQAMKSVDLKEHIRTIPDFPKPGILFYDISTLLRHPGAWRTAVRDLSRVVGAGAPDMLAGIEARGFLVAGAIAVDLGIGLAMVRKPGKLPGATLSHSYELEYRADSVEIQTDAVESGRSVVVVDDVLATGGTAMAAIELLRRAGAHVAAAAFVIELGFLDGRACLDVPVVSLVRYDR